MCLRHLTTEGIELKTLRLRALYLATELSSSATISDCTNSAAQFQPSYAGFFYTKILLPLSAIGKTVCDGKISNCCVKIRRTRQKMDMQGFIS